jgi:hypothetical protein
MTTIDIIYPIVMIVLGNVGVIGLWFTLKGQAPSDLVRKRLGKNLLAISFIMTSCIVGGTFL